MILNFNKITEFDLCRQAVRKTLMMPAKSPGSNLFLDVPSSMWASLNSWTNLIVPSELASTTVPLLFSSWTTSIFPAQVLMSCWVGPCHLYKTTSSLVIEYFIRGMGDLPESVFTHKRSILDRSENCSSNEQKFRTMFPVGDVPKCYSYSILDIEKINAAYFSYS